MSERLRTTRSLAVAFGVATLITPAAHAQGVAIAPSFAASAPVATPAPATAPASVGPTVDAASVAVRHVASTETAAAPRRGGYGQPIALMVVGGAAVLVGLIIGGGAGAAIAIGGAVAGLIGLYQYLQ